MQKFQTKKIDDGPRGFCIPKWFVPSPAFFGYFTFALVKINVALTKIAIEIQCSASFGRPSIGKLWQSRLWMY